MTTGMISPSISAPEVFALNCLQKSIMFNPCWPKAGPTGGAGVALPAAICSLICAVTFFPLGAGAAILYSFNQTLELLHLQEIEFHRRRPSENSDHHLQRVAVEIDVIDHAGEVIERTIDNLDRLVFLKCQLRRCPFARSSDAVYDLVHFLFRKRRRRLAASDESRDARSGFHDVPHVVIHLHLDEHITRIKQAMALHLLIS